MERLGFAVWYDNRASDLTKEGMREGIVQAAAFLLFLSDGVLERPFCESILCMWCMADVLAILPRPLQELIS
jgi:hypothetical protein